jgi:LacI family transcriptional regulator
MLLCTDCFFVFWTGLNRMDKKIPNVVLLIETSREFGRSFMYGVARYSRNHGPWAFYKELGGLNRSLPDFEKAEVDGIIMRNPQKYNTLISLNRPAILIIHEEFEKSHFPKVITDGEKVGCMAAEHYMDKGFQNFGFCGFSEMSWSRERERFFNLRLEEAGYTCHKYAQPRSTKQRAWEHEKESLVDWIRSLPKPVGILACNDERGQHVSEACKIAGLRVPDDVAILGVDNDVLVCDLSDPPLSSIALNTEKAGYETARLLDDLMKGQAMEGQRILVEPTRIVERQSSNILAVDDENVARAVRFICDNVDKPIQVDDVAQAAAMSRRMLERRFRKFLNRSINEEVKRIRIKRCIQLMFETDLSISEIARTMGFSGIEHISRYFRNAIGMSLSAYRRNLGK